MPPHSHTPVRFLVHTHKNEAPPVAMEIGVVSQHNQGLFFARRGEHTYYIASVHKNPALLGSNDVVLEEHATGVTLYSLLVLHANADSGIVCDQLEDMDDGFQLRMRVPNPFCPRPGSDARAFEQTLRFFAL